jgi:hypothetical protein
MIGGALKIAEKFVAIEPDGTIVTMNEQALYVAAPVTGVVNIPFGDKEPFQERTIVTAKALEDLYKMVPRDTLFGGVFENISLTDNQDDGVVNTRISNGRSESTFTMRKIQTGFPDWKSMLKSAWTNRNSDLSAYCFNRERMTLAVDSLNTACKYSGAFSPVFEYHCTGGQVIWRSINELTGQRVWVLFTDAGDGHELPLSKWESGIFGISRK